ncbi:MAG: tetratricopeptide repeat protein [Verrucomicrobiia bacterium]
MSDQLPGVPLPTQPGLASDEPTIVRLEQTAWEKYGRTIITTASVGVLAIVAYALITVGRATREAAAIAAYAKAQVSTDFAAIVRDFPGTPAAGDALLQLAGLQRDDGKFGEEETTLSRFLAEYPRHPLKLLATIALGRAQDAQGRADDAIATLLGVVSAAPASEAASMASLEAGRIAQRKGDIEQARRLLQQAAATQFSSNSARSAAFELRLLEAAHPTAPQTSQGAATSPGEGQPSDRQPTETSRPAEAGEESEERAPATSP